MDTTTFVAAVRRQAVVPSLYADADVLATGDQEIVSVFVPLLERVRQNFLVRELTAVADARGRIAIPERAVSGGLRSVQLATGNGWLPLPQLELADADFITASSWPAGYVLDGGSIKLLPTGVSGTLRLRYACRPSQMALLTDTSKVARVTVVSEGGTNTSLTVAANTIPGTFVDVVASGSVHHLKAINAPFTGTLSTGGPIVLVNTALTESPVAAPAQQPSDLVCLPGFTGYVPLPEELSGALVHRTAGAILRQLGYEEEASSQLGLAAAVTEGAVPMLMPRNEGNPKTVRGGLRGHLGRDRRRLRYW